MNRRSFARDLALTAGLALAPAVMADAPEAAPPETVTRHAVVLPGGETAEYLVYEPATAVPPIPPEKRALVVYLYGAGGSIQNYNLKREPYARLRADFAKRGWCVLVPELGPRHFMNDAAKARLDAMVERATAEYAIPPSRLAVMGTSMGGGSALAYAVHRKDAVRAVVAFMPMTDFAAWAQENPKYGPPIAAAYGGPPEEAPEAYARNSAVANAATLAQIPVMLVHGDVDPAVSVEQSRRLAAALAAAGGRCVLREAVGAAHQDDVVEPYQEEVAAFLDAAME